MSHSKDGVKKKRRKLVLDKDMRLFKLRRNPTLLLKQLSYILLFLTVCYILRSSLSAIWMDSSYWDPRNSSNNVLVFDDGTVQRVELEDIVYDDSDNNTLPDAKTNNTEGKKVYTVYSPVNVPESRVKMLPNTAERTVRTNKVRYPSFNVSMDLSSEEDRSSYPPLFEVYSGSGVSSGLREEGESFLLNGKAIRILSGSINYFRVHPHYWKDRMKKLRAMGFNTVETFVPWNLHEPRMGQYNFTGGWANVRKFIETAKEEDLLVILRPGPYICTQWDFGGLPSFLLRNDVIQYRSLDPTFFTPARKYLNALGVALHDLQWSQKYGAQPIIMVQLENEFVIDHAHVKRDQDYILGLKRAMEEGGMSEVQYIVTNKPTFINKERIVPGVLQAISVTIAATHALSVLDNVQPGRPKMVMEYWTGMYDRFFDSKHTTGEHMIFLRNFWEILQSGASVNLYMFHGGSNFGFLGGGSHIRNESVPRPTTTSFDFDAPLSESGDYTERYWSIRNMVARHHRGLQYKVEKPPKPLPKFEYAIARIGYYMPLNQVLESLPVSVYQRSPRNMEALHINLDNGQGYGFILYRKTWLKLNPGSVLRITGIVRDVMYIMVDGKLINKPISNQLELLYDGYWASRNPEFELHGDGETHQLDLLVEAMARFDSRDLGNQRKGIRGSVYVDEELVTDWQVFPMEFKKSWIQSLDKWQRFDSSIPIEEPALYKGYLNVHRKEAHDTFINIMEEGSKWTKGQVFVNGFNLGRYWNVGPTQTLYVPGPLLRTGRNEVIFFELFKPGHFIHFEDAPILG